MKINSRKREKHSAYLGSHPDTNSVVSGHGTDAIWWIMNCPVHWLSA
jgi:hypothetical protein